MSMTGKPVPTGHVAQARVAPLPDARGWASSHTARHIEHRVIGHQKTCICCLASNASVCAASLCVPIRPALTYCVTEAHGRNTARDRRTGHLLQLTAALTVSGWCAELWAGNRGAGVGRGLHLVDGRAHCMGTRDLTVGGHNCNESAESSSVKITQHAASKPRSFYVGCVRGAAQWLTGEQQQ